MASNKFKPIMVSFDKTGYDHATERAKQKLDLLDQASVWVHNNIPVKGDVNMKHLHKDMLEYLKDAVLVAFHDVNQLGLSANKLIEAKEIPFQQLIEIQKKYDALDVEVKFVKNVPQVIVERKDFEIWTTSERQNQRLLAGNKFINNLSDLSKYAHVYPQNIMTGTSGFIRFDMRDNKYYVNPEFVFSN